MERKQYTVYKIILPSGNQYVGYTSMTVQERMRGHIQRAKSGTAKEHPFYKELKNTDKSNCKIEIMGVFDNRMAAMEAERSEILKVPTEQSLNISAGGIEDASFGGKVFWERLNKDPEKRKAYLKKLSEIKKNNDWSDYDALTRKSLQWRKEHPREAYKMSYRAIRIANKALKQSRCGEQCKETLSLKERLLRKHKLNSIKQKYVTEIWAKRSETERNAIFHKISETHKQKNSLLTKDEKCAMTQKAREHIDRKKQGVAASKGIKKFWEELKKDPERYEKYIKTRRNTLLKTLERKKNDSNI